MASLKHNGEELARRTYRVEAAMGVHVTDTASFGSRGYLLVKRSVQLPDNSRTTGNWTRKGIGKWTDGTLEQAVEACDLAYRLGGWEVLE